MTEKVLAVSCWILEKGESFFDWDMATGRFAMHLWVLLPQTQADSNNCINWDIKGNTILKEGEMKVGERCIKDARAIELKLNHQVL